MQEIFGDKINVAPPRRGGAKFFFKLGRFGNQKQPLQNSSREHDFYVPPFYTPLFQIGSLSLDFKNAKNIHVLQVKHKAKRQDSRAILLLIATSVGL